MNNAYYWQIIKNFKSYKSMEGSNSRLKNIIRNTYLNKAVFTTKNYVLFKYLLYLRRPYLWPYYMFRTYYNRMSVIVGLLWSWNGKIIMNDETFFGKRAITICRRERVPYRAESERRPTKKHPSFLSRKSPKWCQANIGAHCNKIC